MQAPIGLVQVARIIEHITLSQNTKNQPKIRRIRDL